MGTELTNIGSTGYFPRHKRSEKEKNERYFIDCVEAGITLANSNDIIKTATGVRSSKREKIIAYDLYDNKVDKNEVEKTLNPLGIFNTTEFPANYRNYPLFNPRINLLCGEERKRVFNPQVTVINADAVTKKSEAKKEMFYKWYVQKLEAQQLDEKQLEKSLKDFDKFMRYSWKDARERMSSQLLKYLYHTQDIKEEFSRGFKDALICGEEIYIVEIYGGEPILRKANPKNISTIRTGGSWKIEDSDIIVEDSYLSVGEVLDRYYDYLTPTQVKAIEDGYSLTGGSTAGGRFLRPELYLPEIEFVDLTNLGAADINKWSTTLNGAYDSEGNVRVTRVVWAGMRKLGIIYKFNENGELEKDIVPEQYVPNKELGEEVKWVWVKEWYEATKLGPDIYVKMQPCEVQMRHRDNLSESSPGIVGSVYNTNDSVGKGLIGLGKDWQYLWNTFWYRTELAFIKDRGRVGMFPIHLIPDDWGPEAALYWAENMGWLPINAFNQGQEGFAKGKLAGAMSGMPSEINLSNDRQIQNNLMMLQTIKAEVDALTGITPQRMGAIDNRETVGGIERSVMQSSNITEEWFSVHDNTRVRALRAFLEAAKIAYRDQSFTKEFVLDDGTKEMLEFDYDVFVEASYGVDVTNTSNDAQVLQALKGLAERAAASGSLAMAAKLIRTDNASSIVREITDYEEEARAQQAEQVENEQAIMQQQIEEQRELELARMDIESQEKALDRELKQYEIDSNNETKLAIAEINTYIGAENTDLNNNGIPDPMEIAAQALKEREADSKMFTQQREQQRKEKETEMKQKAEERKTKLEEKKLQMQEKQMELQAKLKEKELKFKEADSKRKARIAKTNKNKYDK